MIGIGHLPLDEIHRDVFTRQLIGRLEGLCEQHGSLILNASLSPERMNSYKYAHFVSRIAESSSVRIAICRIVKITCDDIGTDPEGLYQRLRPIPGRSLPSS